MTPSDFLTSLHNHHYQFVTGVPDSLFNALISEVNQDTRFQHVISNNEGEACALAAGYHLGSGKIPVVYLQNSGLGNCINPLTSLLDEWIYAIPALLLIGWRAKPGEPDEPQHRRMGSILPDLLALLNIPYIIIDADEEKLAPLFQKIQDHFSTHNTPFALIFTKHVLQTSPCDIETNGLGLMREQLLEHLVKHSQPQDIFVTTTGKTSRELYEIRERLQCTHESDFLTVGSMGCASSIALGIAMQQPSKRIIVIDGDGACLMRLEAMATIGHVKPNNFLHILVDNNAYESTGAQQTQSHQIDFAAIARACGYQQATSVHSLPAFIHHVIDFQYGPSLLVVKVMSHSNKTLGRPKSTPLENKQRFMQHLGVS